MSRIYNRKQTFIWAVIMALLVTGMTVLAARADDLPEAAYIAGVNGHAQAYMLSCESRSAADWAAFWGVEIDESEFLHALPRSDNPDEGFVGDPNEPWGRIPPSGYGVHADPVSDLLNEYGFDTEAYRDLAWDDIRAEIAAGRPVIVWVIGQMWWGTPVSYTSAEGDTTTVAYFEHTMILVGYDSTYVYVIDAYTGVMQTYYVDAFLNSWQVLGNMAIFGAPQGELEPPPAPTDTPVPTATPIPTPTPTPIVISAEGNFMVLPLVQRYAHLPSPSISQDAQAIPETYTVVKGDYLIRLADRLGLEWHALAEINRIKYPWIIYPGQVIRLR